jgi:hypothetical protein
VTTHAEVPPHATWKHALAVAATATAAIIARKLATPLSERWAWALFGAFLLSGQIAIIDAITGRYPARPTVRMLRIAAGATLGALIGAFIAVR